GIGFLQIPPRDGHPCLALRFGPSPPAEDLHLLRHNMPGAQKEHPSRGREGCGERGLEEWGSTGYWKGSAPRGLKAQGPRGMALGPRNLATLSDEPWPWGKALCSGVFVVFSC